MFNLKQFKSFYRHLKPVKFQFAIAIIAGIVYGLSSGLGLPIIAEKVFPLLFEDGDKNKVPSWLSEFVTTYIGDSDHLFLILVCLALPCMMAVRGISAYINSFFMMYCGVNVVQAIQKEVFSKIQYLPLDFFNKSKVGMVVATVVNMPNMIKTVIVDVSNDLVKQPFTLIASVGYMTMLAINSPGARMALIGALSVPLCIFPIRRVGKYIVYKTKMLVELEGGLNDIVIETAQSPMEIRAFNLQKKQIASFRHTLSILLKFTLKRARFMLALTPIIEIISAFGIAVSLYLGVINGMSHKEFSGLLIALFMSYEPIKKLGKMNNTLATAQKPLEMLLKVLNMKNAVPEADDPVRLTEKSKGAIEFRNVNFKYAGTKQLALEKVNVKVRPGEVIALVGHSGAGKTSFANLIPRFYDTNAGKVLLDGIDIKELSKNDLREQIALVPQMPMLFNESIMENIRMGSLNATDEQVIEAAKQAYAHEFIIDQQKGYKTLIKERGMSLSGGQRQRISLARAFLKDAPIIILDEATSALDNDSEYKIQQALDKLTKGRTVFMIAHRFSSLKSATRTFYFDAGKLIATGTHEELMQSESKYKDLYLKQNI